MPDRRIDLFSIPVWRGNTGDKNLIEQAAGLAYSFRENVGRAALVSDGWDRQETSDDPEDFKRKGVTSFNNCNLLDHPDWWPVASAIDSYAKELISPEWDVSGLRLCNMWATIYPTGAWVPEHIHSGFTLSGVFYVKASEGCGEIVFKDPGWVAKVACNNGESTFPLDGTRRRFTPQAGDLLLFPSFLPHYTEPNKSEEDRIIVSFNIVFDVAPQRVS